MLLIFLSFGHPEGFGLPITEAMASGYWVIGYHGGGGRELFRFGASDSVTSVIGLILSRLLIAHLNFLNLP